MTTLKTSLLKMSVAACLGSIVALTTTAAMTAEAQSGRIKARGERGTASAVRGADGGRAARARGCTGVEGGQACGSGASTVGPEGARAGRASASQIGDDGSFTRDGGAYALNETGEAVRTLDSNYNPDGSGQRSVDGSANFTSGFAERDTLLTVDESGNAVRTGAASGEGELGTFASEGSGSYSQEQGLDFARIGNADLAGEDGAFAADGAVSYDQQQGLNAQRVSGGNVETENGSVASQRAASYTLEEGLDLDSERAASNAAGDTVEAERTFNNDDGLTRNVTCTNAAGETIACVN
ncbi:MAG: hypothetical protein AAFS03_02665 [Pseudomonadota bacterium]